MCGKDSVPLHDVSKPEVLQMMHDEANRRLLRSAELEATAGPRWSDRIIMQVLGVLGALFYWIVRKPRPPSARATLAARQLRESSTAPGDAVPMLLDHPELVDTQPGPFDKPGQDPDLLDAHGLLKWLGATLQE
jgi:hypothetical protein